MQLTVQGKQLDVGNALRTHVETKLEDLNEKFFNHATFANVTFAREGHGHGLIRAHIQIRIGKDINVLADATEGDAYIAFDNAALKVTRQMGKYKERLRDHHQHSKRTPEEAEANSRAYATASKATGEAPRGKDHPVIVAELTTAIRPMSVSDAVMRMDLANAPVVLFRNPKTGTVNMVYRRKDGNIGWVDPDTEKKQQQAKAPVKAPVKHAARAPAKAAAKPAKKSAAKKAPAKKAKSNMKKLKPLVKTAAKKAKAVKRPAKAAPKKAAKRARR